VASSLLIATRIPNAVPLRIVFFSPSPGLQDPLSVVGLGDNDFITHLEEVLFPLSASKNPPDPRLHFCPNLFTLSFSVFFYRGLGGTSSFFRTPLFFLFFFPGGFLHNVCLLELIPFLFYTSLFFSWRLNPISLLPVELPSTLFPPSPPPQLNFGPPPSLFRNPQG